MDCQVDLNHLTSVEVSCWLQEKGIVQRQRVLRGREGVGPVAYQIGEPRSIGLDAADCKRFGVAKGSVRQFQVFQDQDMGWWC